MNKTENKPVEIQRSGFVNQEEVEAHIIALLRNANANKPLDKSEVHRLVVERCKQEGIPLTTLPAVEAEAADTFLAEAAQQMAARAKLRDTAGGERTAGKIAKVFNAITGHDLTEADAWMFLIVLKIVRSRGGKYNRDDYVDLSAYSALLGEHESEVRK